MKLRLPRGELVRSSSAVFAIRLLDMAFAYALVLVLARFLGVDVFGRYSWVLALVNLLVIPARFGLPELLVRETGKAVAAADETRIFGLKDWAYRRAISLSVPIIAVGLIATLFGPIASEAGGGAVVVIGLALVLLIPLAAIRAAILRGMGDIVASQMTLQIIRPAVQFALVGGLLILSLWGLRPLPASAAVAMGANVVGALVAWAAGALLLSRVLHRNGSRDARQIEIPGWRSSVVAFGLANAIQVLDSQLGVLLLGALDSDKAIGLYKVAAQFAMLTSLGSLAVNVTLGPKIATQWASGESDLVRGLVRRGSQLAMLASLPVVLFFLVAGRPFLELTLGDEFGGAYLPLVLLVLGQLTNVAFGPATTLLTMTHHEKYNTMAFAAGTTASVALSLGLIPAYGATGMAVAALASILVRNVLLWRFALRFTKINPAFWAGHPRAARPV